jgi:hypothetical protein
MDYCLMSYQDVKQLLLNPRSSTGFLQLSYTNRGQNASLAHVAHHSGAESICSLLL